ncbi:MAG: DUF2809 domain-containing protein [Rhodopseudomonas sp.]|nr:DUF2809 domain-containing protein [Rhodopseudomonas sp.]
MTERPSSSLSKRRLGYAAVTACIIAAGLLTRRPELGLPWIVAKYSGAVLWGAMVFFAVATLCPALRLSRIALSAAVIAAGVEFSQALHVDWLDAFRHTTFGRLLLGVTFAWADIAAYWVGVAAAWGAAVGVCRVRSSSD